MNSEGPQLETLLHRLAECPPEFLQVTADQLSIDVAAIACDLIRVLSPKMAPDVDTEFVQAIRSRKVPELTLISVVCWLLADEWFRARPELAPAMKKLLTSAGWSKLAGLVRPEKLVSDPDRREELVRLCLDRLGLRPQGETVLQAADRLSTLDSAERDRVLRATAAAEKRAREIRDAMALKRAQESTSRYGE